MREFYFFLFLLIMRFAAAPHEVLSDAQTSFGASATNRELTVHPVQKDNVSEPGGTNFGIAGTNAQQQAYPVTTVAGGTHGNYASAQLQQLLLRACCAAIDMFGNNRLSHNYPVHNFW